MSKNCYIIYCVISTKTASLELVMGNRVSYNQVCDGRQLYTTGIKWECVEFVRRYLILRGGVTFDSVEHAYDMWNLTHFWKLPANFPTLANSNVMVPVKIHHTLKQSYNLSGPKKGDILVWGPSELMPNGHVAIALSPTVLIEQNHPMSDSNGYRRFEITDDLIGWITWWPWPSLALAGACWQMSKHAPARRGP